MIHEERSFRGCAEAPLPGLNRWITKTEAAQLFEKAQERKTDKELSLDELEAVSGGCRAIAVRDHPTDYLAKDLIACEYFKGGWKDRKDAVLKSIGQL